VGIVLSVGHSNASYDVAKVGLNNGIKTATHVFNAMSGLSGRNPGVVGAVMNSDCYTGVIADLIHVSASNIELLHKIKQDKLYIVTDAVTPMGTTLPQFEFAGKTIFVKDGKCVDKNGTLGGANITMNQSVRNLVNSCNIKLVDAFKMAISNPSNVIGGYDKLANIINMPVTNLICTDLENYNSNLLKV